MLTEAETPGRIALLVSVSCAVTAKVATPELTVAAGAIEVILPSSACVEPAGVTWKDVTGTPLEFAIDTVKPVAPLGALTAPAIDPPVASAALVPGASIEWPSRLALLLSCEEDMADCMLCRLDTSLRPSSCPRN